MDAYRLELGLPSKHGYRKGDELKLLMDLSVKIKVLKDSDLDVLWKAFIEAPDAEKPKRVEEIMLYLVDQLFRVTKP